ncbi:hypothetical protein ACJ72_01298 [Emergomyces africanus]|uniref:Uncharacterized protein n=1 Tax=Emergomyces africanus TaxID=1955775 RepID=A0A1B7P5R0_9EURO|nr:hypothetical protein ACJ72_01298 [Emergomyces africanus]
MSSLVIVGIPHLFPCPVPRHAFADSEMIMSSDGQQKLVRKRRRKLVEPQQPAPDASDPENTAVVAVKPRTATTPAERLSSRQQGPFDEEIMKFRGMEEEARNIANIKRECPVPKPGGVVGQLLGFNKRDEGKGRDGIPRADIPGRESGS